MGRGMVRPLENDAMETIPPSCTDVTVRSKSMSRFGDRSSCRVTSSDPGLEALAPGSEDGPQPPRCRHRGCRSHFRSGSVPDRDELDGVRPRLDGLADDGVEL